MTYENENRLSTYIKQTSKYGVKVHPKLGMKVWNKFNWLRWWLP
jgi:hypothetical protein